jgi:hypothetical protein
MYTYADRARSDRDGSAGRDVSIQAQGAAVRRNAAPSPTADRLARLQELANNSPRVKQLRALADQFRQAADAPGPTAANHVPARTPAVPGPASVGSADGPPAPLPPSSAPVQRYLIVGTTDYTRAYKEMAETVTGPDRDTQIMASLNTEITTIARAMLGELDQSRPEEQRIIAAITNDTGDKLRAQLAKWIEDKPGNRSSPKSHPDFGRKNQPRVYANFKDLAFALDGWVNAKPRRHDEKVAAGQLQTNDAVSYHLDTILLKIAAWCAGDAKATEIASELANPYGKIGAASWNIYQAYFAGSPKPSQQLPSKYADVLTNPENYDVRQKTGMLHDLMHYFYEKQQAHSTVALIDPNLENKMRATEFSPGGAGTTRVPYNRPANAQIRSNQRDAKNLVKPEHMPGASGGAASVTVSAEESHGTYRFARAKNIPMYGRHSLSAARMMSMAQMAGGTPKQISAVAWAIMSYWRKDYDHTTIPYHTLHEIMDFTPEFGVAYDPENPFASAEDFSKPGFIATLQEDIRAAPNDRDIKKLLETDSKLNVADFFLKHQALWRFPKVMNFLQMTVLPEDEFQKLDPRNLFDFFTYDTSTRNIFYLISDKKRMHVTFNGILPE